MPKPPVAPPEIERLIEAQLAPAGRAGPHPGYRIASAGADRAEVLIYEDVGASWFGEGLTAKRFVEDLKALGPVKTINVRINSNGGSVFEGFAIYNALRRHSARIEVDVDGIAASIASLIAMAGDEIRMAENAMLMVHEPWSFALGNSADMRKEADLLDQIRGSLIATYAARSNADPARISEMMAAETWLTAAEAVDAGFADQATERMKIAASIDPRFKNVPAALKARAAAIPAPPDPVPIRPVQAALPARQAKAPAGFLLKATTERTAAMDIDQLRARLAETTEQRQLILARCETDKRDPTADEVHELGKLGDEFDRLDGIVKELERTKAHATALNAPQARLSEPAQIGRRSGEPTDEPQARTRVAPQPRDAAATGKWGWRSMGEFASAVYKAGKSGSSPDPLLIQNAATTFGNEGSGTDGGFAVPPDFRATIMQTIMGEDSLIGRTDQLTSSSNTLTVPVDETTPWQTTGGLQAYWDGEGVAATQSKPTLQQINVRLHKLTALVPMTDELLDDAPAMGAYLARKLPEKIGFKINRAIVAGTGAGQPLGILNAPCLVTVSKETGQAAATVLWENIKAMWTRQYSPSRANAVWLINQDIETALYDMSLPIGTGGVPVFLPAGGAADAPYARLFGRPIIPTQANETLGTVGDIILADLTQYLTVQKGGGLRTDTSIHLWFDQGVTAFRATLRIAGQPWWSVAVSPRAGSNTLSPFVALATRA